MIIIIYSLLSQSLLFFFPCLLLLFPLSVLSTMLQCHLSVEVAAVALLLHVWGGSEAAVAEDVGRLERKKTKKASICCML